MKSETRKMADYLSDSAGPNNPFTLFIVLFFLLCFFFWKLKTKTSTIIRLVVFLQALVVFVVLAIFIWLDNGNEFMWVVWLLISLAALCLTRILFDIRALWVGNWQVKSDNEPLIEENK